MSMQPKGLPEIPEQTARVARTAFPKGSLAIRVRDRLAGVFADEPFAEAFGVRGAGCGVRGAGCGVRGAPGVSPGVLCLVTVLRFAEDLSDRQAAAMAMRPIDWKYAIGAELSDTGFDASVLSRFRARLAGNGMERVLFDRLLEHCKEEGLVAAGGKQRTDSTHAISAVRDLNRLELAGESVRAALEALAPAAPAWLAGQVDVAEFAHRYGPRVNGWHMPPSQTKRDRLAQVFGQDALALCRADWSPGAPGWIGEIETARALRQVLVQTYYLTIDTRGRKVIKKRAADGEGVPPGQFRLASPYDTDARWAAMGEDLFWIGYKIHLTESCHAPAETETDACGQKAPNLITDVFTTEATVPDVKATATIQRSLTERGLRPAEHYLDSVTHRPTSSPRPRATASACSPRSCWTTRTRPRRRLASTRAPSPSTGRPARSVAPPGRPARTGAPPGSTARTSSSSSSSPAPAPPEPSST
ncbi:transposase [Streptomyces virginiae]